MFIGPSDLSIALSDGHRAGAARAALMEAAGRIAARAKAHRKYAAMFCFDGADAGAMAALGFRLCSIATDQTLLRGAARAELDGRARRSPPGTRKRRQIRLYIIGLDGAAAVGE